MENKRKDYRHTFSGTSRIPVVLQSHDRSEEPLSGQIADLSVGGMGVHLDSPPPWVLSSERLQTRIALPDDAECLSRHEPRAYWIQCGQPAAGAGAGYCKCTGGTPRGHVMFRRLWHLRQALGEIRDA